MTNPKTAALVILPRDGQLLLGVKQDEELGRGLLNGPGGKQEPGETLLQCAVREALDELKVTVEPGDLTHVGVLHCYADDEPFMYVHVFLAKTFVGDGEATSAMVPEWVSADALPYERMHEADRYWFDKAVRGERFRIAIFYERPGEGYIRHQFLEY